MKRSTVVAVVVVAVLGGLFVLRRTTNILGGRDQVAVQLNNDPADGICKAADPQPGGGAWLHKVTFTVTNNCRDTQYAAFLNYRERLAGGVLSPTPETVVNPDPANSPAINPAAAVDVPVRVTKFYFRFRVTTFKYQICVGPAANPTTNCTDPDFDVWPF
jgi:hypothetical protein